MTTKAEKLAEIEINVNKKIGEILKEEVFNLKTYDVVCLVTIDELGNTNKVSQRLYVENEGTATESATFGGITRKDYVAPAVSDPVADSEAYFLSELQALETGVGQDVLIDVTQLENLGIKYLAYTDPTDSKRKVTTTLSGVKLIREAA